MNYLVLDFESYYSPADKYDLKAMSMVEYVRDSRFYAQGCGVQWLDGPPALWLAPDEIADWAENVDWSQTAVIAHNAKFDLLILAERYGIRPAQMICTKAMSKAVLGRTVPGHSLREIASHFGLAPKGDIDTLDVKGKRELTADEEARLAEYCLHDVELTAAIFERLKAGFPGSQWKPMDWTIRTFVRPVLELDQAVLAETARSEAERRAKIFDLIGIDKKVFASNKKFPALLAERGYEVPTKKSPRTGSPIPALALGDVDFVEMANSENDELADLCEARIAAKSTILETRSAKLLKVAQTGRFPFDVEFSGAMNTHRYSGGSGAGGNPQNFPRCQDPDKHGETAHVCRGRLRSAVRAPDGMMLVVGDFASVEPRFVAYMANDAGLIAALAGDPYCAFASSFYGRPITKKDDAERRFGKEAILGLGYGMGWRKFQVRATLKLGRRISEADARKAVALYRKMYRRVTELWSALDGCIGGLCAGQAVARMPTGVPLVPETERLILPDGPALKYPNLRLSNDGWIFTAWGKSKGAPTTEKLYGGKMLENISQALAGVLCKEACAKFYDVAVGTVHDEIILCVPEADAPRYRDELEAAMTAAPAWLPALKLKADVKAAKNWLGAK